MKPRVINRRTTEREEALAALGKFDGATCVGKARYASRNDARAAAKSLARLRDRPMAVYRCPICHQYHITKNTGED